MTYIGVIAFAFGQQKTKAAGPSNEVIGEIALGVKRDERSKGHPVLLATQWEVAHFCDELSESPDFRASAYADPDTHYISTKDVLDASLEFFADKGVERVILIAHPVHLFLIRLLIVTKRWGIGEVTLDMSYNKRLHAIPYDTSSGNLQEWTRGFVPFVKYLIRVLRTGKHGN